MEINKSMFDIAMAIISIYIPFFITNKAEKAKEYRENIFNISNSFHLIRLEINHNHGKLRSISKLLKENVFHKTKYYGRNHKIYNRKKHYLEKNIINDLYTIKKIDTTLLNNLLLTGKKDNEIFNKLTLEIYNYNYLVNDIKGITIGYDKQTLLLDKNSINNIVNILEKLINKEDEIINCLDELLKLAKSQSDGLLRMYNFPKYYTLIASIFFVLISIFKIVIYLIYGINITNEIKVLNGAYWFLFVSISIIALTSTEIIFKK